MKFIILLVLLLSITATFAKYHSAKHLHRYRLRHHLKLRHRLRLSHAMKQDETTTEESSSSSTTTTSSSSSSTTTSSGPPPDRYPDTDDDSLTNTALNTWIAKTEWKSSLVEDPLPEAMCIKVGPAKKKSGAEAANGPIMKHLELRKQRISDGYAAYFFDQTDHFLLNLFEEDVKASFKAFYEKNDEANKVDNAGDNLEEGKVDTKAFTDGAVEFKWDTKKNPVEVIRSYAIDSQNYDEKKTTLNLQEFVYMNIFENAKAKAANPCTNCMEKTKAAIKEFFDYLDCNHDGNISAENIYYGMENMKDMVYPKTTTTMINDFVLNTMEFKSSALNIIDFQYGLLVGMYERVITENGMSEVQLNSMKVGRREVIEGGGGPAFRRRKLL